MSTNYKIKKVERKQKRCESIIERECGIISSTVPTRFLAILNAGISTGLSEDHVIAAAESGEVIQLLMIPGKSYCFIETKSVDDAERIFQAMHNASKIGQNDAVVFMAYFQKLPKAEKSVWQKPLPTGLLVLPNFVSLDEESALLKAISVGDITEGKLKQRFVRHFGYEFLYGPNNVDTSRPLLKFAIPAACDVLWPRLQQVAKEKDLSFEWKVPDQLTVNEYEPGQGIPPHVDTHSAFRDPILSLSLQGEVVMDFRRGVDRISVVLPRRSLLVMTGASRYDWTHGITARIIDVVPTSSGALTTQVRTRRISLTFRCLRASPCDCSFPTLCDTRLQATSTPDTELKQKAVQLEQCNVHRVYDHIAHHFSETRHTPWPKVASFLKSFEPGSVVVDVGCGNGKYLNCNQDLLTMGCDRSHGLLSMRVAKSDVFRCDCLHIPVRSQSVDGCICIAVIHHLATPERRRDALREIARILRKGGRALVYVWAKDQRADSKKSSYLLQNKAINKHKSTEEQQRQVTEHQLQKNDGAAVSLPVHTNRTNFLQQDVLVPWKLKGEEHATFLRYYHVFEQLELEQLVAQLPEVQLLQSYYDQGNHCLVFQRK